MSGQDNYARGWRCFWGGTIAVSVAASALAVRPMVLLGTAATGALIAAVVSLVISSDREEPLPDRLSRLRMAMVWGAGAMAAVVFLGTLSGSLMLALLFVALVSSPPVVLPAHDWVKRMTHPAQDTAGQLSVEQASRDVLVRLSSAELCQTWRTTHRRLRFMPPVDEVAAYARLRGLVLEELERRHPQEVAEWLSAGGNAEEAPEHFLPLDPQNG